MYTNHFVLMKPNGEIAWNYLKAFPVGAEAGPRKPAQRASRGARIIQKPFTSCTAPFIGSACAEAQRLPLMRPVP